MATAATVRELRRARRTRRLGQLEWFEIAYRVYLTALVGGVIIAWLSGLVQDDPVTSAQLADILEYGPGVLGLFAVAAFALGLRSGSDGGPISLEAGDVRHLMTAPVPRRAVLLTPVVQRCRAVAFGGLLVGGVAGRARRPSPARLGAGMGGQRRRCWRVDRFALRGDGRARPRPARPALGSDDPRHDRGGRPGRRRDQGWYDRATASAAWRCGACAPTSRTSSRSPPC